MAHNTDIWRSLMTFLALSVQQEMSFGSIWFVFRTNRELSYAPSEPFKLV
jgi:hypothetical protein